MTSLCLSCSRYTLDVDLKNVVVPEKLESKAKRVEARKVGVPRHAGLVAFALLCISFDSWCSSVDMEVVNFLMQETKSVFEERFKTGKNRWFFSKLRF